MDDLVIVSMGARRVELDCAGPPHWRGSPPFSGANAGSAHSTRRACHFPLSLSLLLSLLLSLFLFSASFPVSFLCYFSLLEIKQNFVPRKRFKRYKRGLKTCFVRGKRFRRNKTVCDVDDLVIVRLACVGCCYFTGSKKLKWTRP